MAKFVINWEEVKTFEDIKRILEALDMEFHGKLSDYPLIQDLLIPDIDPNIKPKYKA